MKKLLKVLVVLFLLGVIAVVALGFFIGPIVKKAVNTVGPKVTGTTVELADAKLSPFTGKGTLVGFVVGNPNGWTDKNAFNLDEIRVDIEPRSILGEAIVVNEVYINAPKFYYEHKLLGGSNIDALIKQIEANTGASGKTTPTETAPAPSSGAERKFIIKSFRLENATVRLSGVGESADVTLPPLTLTDLGVAEGGLTADQLGTAVLKQVLAQISNVAGGIAKDIGNAAINGGSDGAKEAAKGALNKLLGR